MVGEPFLLATEILIGIVVYVCLMLIIQRSFVLELAARVRSVCLHQKGGLRAGKLCA